MAIHSRRGRPQRALLPFLLPFALGVAAAGDLRAAPDCAECHDAGPSAESFAESVHGAFECTDCHSAAAEFPHGDGVENVDCAFCHEDAVAEFGQSVHGRAREEWGEDAPTCTSCHGDIHQLVPSGDPRSPLHPATLPRTCGQCHSEPAALERYGIRVGLPVEAYEASVHGRAAAEGGAAATCSSCHGAHLILEPSDDRSTVYRQRVPETCGQCHGDVTAQFQASVHGKAAAFGVRESPVCTDCHGEHRILSPTQRGSTVFATNIPKMTCGRCHSDLRLAEKFGIPGDKVPSYEDSYHGLASRTGSQTVAHCGSCHGIHDILPSSDPASHVHPDNLPDTCGSCHPGAGKRFSVGPVHVVETDPQHRAVYFVRQAYVWLIFLTIGGMLAHNLLDLFRKVRSPLPRPDRPLGAAPRMRLGFRIAHLVMMLSFTVLAYSGFALKYPESWWAQPLLAWEGSLRGWVHRVAAVAMLGALLIHVVHLAIDRQARACIARMRPTLADVHEFKDRLAWYLGRRDTPPHTPSLGYPEKMEYLALMWGIVVMTVTGFALWFEGWALRWMPKWASDVATVIHFYEAILATLAILVWHFYFVIFDPVVYPMDTAWVTGRSPEGRNLERDERALSAALAKRER